MALGLLLCSAVHGTPLPAQSVVRGDVGGRVTAAGGLPIREAEVGVEELRTGTTRWTETLRDGSFHFPSLPPGEYSVRFEALGYRPVVYEGVPVRAGRSLDLRVELPAMAPPVNAVDVVPYRDLASTRLAVEGSRSFGRRELLETPEAVPGLPAAAARSAGWDPLGGSQGLPAWMTSVYVDGVPFVPARHPYRPSEDLGLGALPTAAVAQLGLIEEATDAEWSGAAGQMEVGTHSSGALPAVDLSGYGSHTSLWHSGSFTGGPPGSVSHWLGGSADLPLVGGGARLAVAAEAGSVRTPREVAVDDPNLLGILGTDPAASGIDARWMEHRDLFAGFARLDWTSGTGTEVMARVNAGHTRTTADDFFTSPAEYGAGSAQTGSDVSGALSVGTPIGSRFLLEVRGGLGWSRREFGTSAGDGSGSELPATLLVSEGIWLGKAPGADGRVVRRGAFGTSAVHMALGEHRLKAGWDLAIASYEYGVPPAAEGAFYFADGDDLLARDGAFVGLVGGAARTAFSTSTIGAFLQYQWNPTSRLLVTSGLRWSREGLPSDRVATNARWRELTGISTSDLPDAVSAWSARFAARWDLAGNGASVLTGALGTHGGEVDPAVLHEAILLDGPVEVRRAGGALGAWPEAPSAGVVGTARPTLSIVNPGFRAPMTTRATAAFSQRLVAGTTVRVSGTVRRTEHLPRRTDLNRALLPSASSNLGRDLYGDLTKFGSGVLVTDASNRRFDEFDRVWALNSDGVSDYLGLTLALEHAMGPFDITAEYTYSTTEDDWVGAGTGVPEARLSPALPETGGVGRWERGTSDFDVPHRFAVDVAAALDLFPPGTVTLGATLRVESGLPFTPTYGSGADVNGDGSSGNDPAYIPDETSVQDLMGEWPCLGAFIGQVVGRNACRGPVLYTVDARMAVRLVAIGGLAADLLVEGFNLLDARTGVRDTALFHVDPDSPLVGAGTGSVEIPTVLNPRFGEISYPTGLGRRVRIGVRVTTP